MSHQWILLRGLGREQQHSQQFVEQLRKANSEYEVVTIDLPGAGRFHRVSSPMTIRGIAEFVHSQLPEGRPEKRSLVAVSLGGMVAMELIQLYPDQYDSCVVINTSFRNLSTIGQRLQMEAFWYLLKAGLASSLESREKEVLSLVSNNPRRYEWLSSWTEIARQRPVSPLNFLKQLLAAAFYDLPLQKPTVPLFVLTSEADRMVSSECSKKLAEHWQLPLAVHNTGGHELYIDDPEWVIQKLQLYCGKS